MIIDTIPNWQFYPYGQAWKTAFEFLTSLTAGAEEGDYRLQGEEIFARVVSYPTRPPTEAILEAHRTYIDIQSPLIGAERIEWFPTAHLAVASPYDLEKDVELFHRPAPGLARVDLFPGTFAMFWPHDAHMPMLAVGEPAEPIKKVVVKIMIDLLPSTEQK